MVSGADPEQGKVDFELAERPADSSKRDAGESGRKRERGAKREWAIFNWKPIEIEPLTYFP